MEGDLATNVVVFKVHFDTPLGPIRGKVQVSTGPMPLVDLVPTALELTDILVRRACERETKEGRSVSCKAGCGVCCYQMVPLSPPEAIWISKLVDHLEKSKEPGLADRFDNIAKRLQGLGMVEDLLDPDYSDDVALDIARKYFSLKIPCPFLYDDSCSIYPYRPVACREYNVTSSPEYCADPYSNNVVKVAMPLPLSAPLARLTAKLTDTKPRLIPLTLARRWYLENEDLSRKSWPGMELLQRFLEEIGGSKKNEK